MRLALDSLRPDYAISKWIVYLSFMGPCWLCSWMCVRCSFYFPFSNNEISAVHTFAQVFNGKSQVGLQTDGAKVQKAASGKHSRDSVMCERNEKLPSQ